MGKEGIISVILAAGKGTRMKSECPKVLHKIFGKELISYVIESCKSISEKIYVVTGHKNEIVEDFIKREYPNEWIKPVLQRAQKGTGDALKQVLPEIGEQFFGDVVVLCGDTPILTERTIEELVNFHKEEKNDVTLMTAYFEDPGNYGRIVRDKSSKKVIAIVEHTDATESERDIREVNSGVYCFNWEKIRPLCERIENRNAQGEYYLTDIIEVSVRSGLKVGGYRLENKEEIFGVNSQKDLSEAFKIINKRHLLYLMMKGVTIFDELTTFISPETEILKDTIIYPNVYINGKNRIGSECSIGPFAHLRGNVEIADRVKIGNFVELKNAIVKSDTNICHLSYVGDAQIAECVNIGAGTIFANYNTITKEKNCTIVQRGASIGSNSVLVAPVKVGEYGFVGASSTVTKDVNKNDLLVCRGEMKTVKEWVIKEKRKKGKIKKEG